MYVYFVTSAIEVLVLLHVILKDWRDIPVLHFLQCLGTVTFNFVSIRPFKMSVMFKHGF